MRVIKRKKSKKHIFFRLAVLALVAYVAVSLGNQQVQIRAKEQELEALNQQIEIVEIKNTDIKRVLDSDDEEVKDYIERAAREGNLNLTYPGERVFINIAGN